MAAPLPSKITELITNKLLNHQTFATMLGTLTLKSVVVSIGVMKTFTGIC